MFNLILVPAYGRFYETASDALADWNDGKDFRVPGNGPYCSKRDISRLAMLHNNVILSSRDGGAYVVRGHNVNP